MQATILSLRKKGLHPDILCALHNKLHWFLQLGKSPLPSFAAPIQEAIHRQNIIGWRQFLCGYVFQKWNKAQHSLDSPHVSLNTKWGKVIIQAALSLHHSIWHDRNHTFIRVTSTGIQNKEYECVQTRIKELYKENPTLNKKIIPKTDVPLHTRRNACRNGFTK